MTTSWTLPTNIIQYAEPGAETEHVSWDDSDNFSKLKNLDSRSVQSNGSLRHIARSPKHDLKNKTWFLKITGFNFENLPASLTGIEVKISARRYGRATDDTVALSLNDQLIGDNKATLSINPEKIYGGSTDLWNTSNLTIADIMDPSFGVVVRFQAHPHWPHNDPVLIDAVELRIH